MTANVEPEEAEALRDALQEGEASAAVVAERDFSRPVRLSEHDLDGLRRRLSNVMEDVETQFSELLGKKTPVSLTGSSEMSAADLFAEEQDVYAAVRFTAAGQPGWVLWDNVAAIRAVEKVLGSVMVVKNARRLSAIECSVLETFLSTVADACLRAVDVEASDLLVVQSRDALGSWQDAGDEADPHRLHISLEVEGPGGSSSLDVYLPMGLAAKAAASERIEELPQHLDPVDVGVSVRVEGTSVRLSELLELEEGDVIPLDGYVGDPAVLCIEGKPVARGKLGTRRGNLAIRIEHMTEEPEQEQ